MNLNGTAFRYGENIGAASEDNGMTFRYGSEKLRHCAGNRIRRMQTLPVAKKEANMVR
jgi:hypothetical protein